MRRLHLLRRRPQEQAKGFPSQDPPQSLYRLPSASSLQRPSSNYRIFPLLILLLLQTKAEFQLQLLLLKTSPLCNPLIIGYDFFAPGPDAYFVLNEKITPKYKKQYTSLYDARNRLRHIHGNLQKSTPLYQHGKKKTDKKHCHRL